MSNIDALVASWSGSSKENAGKVIVDSTPRLHPHRPPPQIQTTTLASSASSQYFSHLLIRTQSSKRPPGPAKEREIEIFITKQPTIGGKDDYDSENSWISEGLPGSSRRKSRGEGRGKGGRGREKASASEVEVGVDGAKSEIKIERRRVPECSTEDRHCHLVIAALARTAACPSATTTFSRASVSLLSTSTPDEGWRAQAKGLEEALRYDV